MLQPPPARPGMREDEVDTPALLIDLDVFEDNLDHMADCCAERREAARACQDAQMPVIARLQMARGAVGQCVQKVAEAEALACAGIRDMLVSNEVVGASKLARACCARAASARSGCASMTRRRSRRSRAARRMPASACGAGRDRCRRRPLRRRAGPGRGGAGEAHRRPRAPDLRRPAGVSRQRAAPAHRRRTPRRDRRCDRSSRRTVDHLRQQGLECPIVSGAGTGTFQIEVRVRRVQRNPGGQLRVHGRRLCDMPGMDGLEATRRLSTRTPTRPS